MSPKTLSRCCGKPFLVADVRAFLAVSFHSFYVDELKSLIESLKTLPLEVKWIDPASAHLTLHFFGEVSLPAMEALFCELRAVAARQKPFYLTLDGLGAFPHWQSPRVLWVGVKGDLAALDRLKAETDAALKKNGFLIDTREFKPHLTLGRVKVPPKNFVPPSALNPSFAAPFSIKEIVLFESKLFKSGPLYTPMQTFSFAPY